MMLNQRKKANISIRVSEDKFQSLQLLSQYFDTSLSNVVRSLIFDYDICLKSTWLFFRDADFDFENFVLETYRSALGIDKPEDTSGGYKRTIAFLLYGKNREGIANLARAYDVQKISSMIRYCIPEQQVVRRYIELHEKGEIQKDFDVWAWQTLGDAINERQKKLGRDAPLIEGRAILEKYSDGEDEDKEPDL